VFVIDPKRVIRAIICYPMNAGRNIDERRIVRPSRRLTRMQPPGELAAGEKVVVPPPKSVAEVTERLGHTGKDYDVKDFYLSFKELPKTKGSAA
jgi:peroxiredoxin (alkyl hydroperoxide reductase subunit C)